MQKKDVAFTYKYNKNKILRASIKITNQDEIKGT